MKKNLRSDLETAARQMLLVHRADELTDLILTIIVRNIKVRHCGIFLYDKASDEYIVRVSKGEKGIKVPEGFTKVRKSNPLIRFFTDPSFAAFQQDALLSVNINKYLRMARAQPSEFVIQTFHDLRMESSLYEAKAFIPGFFRNNLVAVLFLGSKEKPTAFTKDELSFLSVLASDVVMGMQNAWLFEDLRGQLDINKKMFLNTVTALAAAIETKDPYTMGHTERVARYSVDVARCIQGGRISNPREFEENLRIAALLHDIGKIGVPEDILNKNGALTEKERQFVHRHPVMGGEILNPINEFKAVILGVKYHHEWYDGTGYPYRLSGSEIPLVAAIISVADAYDAMTTARPYRAALSHEDAVREVRACSGTQFDPEVVAAFMRAFGNRSKTGEVFAGLNPLAASPSMDAKIPDVPD